MITNLNTLYQNFTPWRQTKIGYWVGKLVHFKAYTENALTNQIKDKSDIAELGLGQTQISLRIVWLHAEYRPN